MPSWSTGHGTRLWTKQCDKEHSMSEDNRDPVRAALQAFIDLPVGPAGYCSLPIAELQAAARAAISTPNGWKLVPVEPTPEMAIAADKADNAVFEDSYAEYRAIYQAMLAAADPP